jgi:DNA-binding NarL/FixJ family response regulator
VGVTCRVLLVDDNQPFLDAARVLLERQGLSVVGVASTGAQALLRAEQLEPDLVLLDISLGDESGFDVVRSLVERDQDGAMRVILISTHAETDLADLIAGSPAIGFLPKSELSVSAIERILDGHAS